MARRLFILGFLACIPAMPSSPYSVSVESWRKERESRLKAPDGWLALAGLFWLKEGENRVGSDPSYEIVLPDARAPQRVGVFDFHKGNTTFRVASGAHVSVNGKGVLTAELKPDTSGKPDLLQIGDFTMLVIQRGPRYAIRLRDLHSKAREEFTKLRWYPVRPQYRIVAKFVSYDQPKTIAVPNILGQVDNEPSPGYATFQLMGHGYRLDPVLEDGQLFFIFRDLTSGKTTYGAGRFLYADLPKEGKIVLDFNKAYNPPCAFTPYATCPLPPKQNRLPVKIEAGELTYGNH
jgi:uncharacterized protein